MTHRNVNHVLTILVITLAIFILIAPFLGQLDWLMNGPSKTPEPQFVTNYKKDNTAQDSTTPPGKYLYIPSIGASAEVLEGSAASTVDKGLWHRPASAEPGDTGNTVIVGHRFSYNPRLQQPLYQLDKVSVGDSIFVQWNDKVIEYAVTDKKVVKATEIRVEAPTKDAQLTLYTCTPLWNPVDRLVVVAKPVKEQQ